jgi:DNA recombination protein RmuC
MEVNLFSVETLLGLVIGLLLAFFIKNFLKKEEDINDYAANLKNLTNTIEKFQDDNSSERGSIKQILNDIKTGEADVVKAAEEIRKTLVSGGGQQQGAWGEMVLSHILKENLQFTEGEEFEIRKGFNTEEGKKIPDVIIHFPDGRDAMIDSKVSLTAWDQYVNAVDEKSREDALARHKQSIKNHIDGLAKKNYQDIKEINTLDTIIMFCPNEKAISDLPRESSRKMMEYAISKKITLVGPSMLYYTLKTAEYSWKADKQSKNVQNIIDIANKVGSQAVEIYESAEEAKASIEKTSKGIDKVTSKISDGKGSFLSKIKKMNKLGGLSPKKNIPLHVDEEDEDENKITKNN